jgi:peptidylprolyl isomerase
MGANKKPVTFPNGLKYVDVKVGSGTRASTGMSANVDYSLYLTSGKLIQSSINSGSGPLTLTIGSSGTIPGFSQGVAGMRIGGIRRLVIPPNLGFGNSPPQSSGIPDNATLVFLVRLNSVSAATPSPSPS